MPLSCAQERLWFLALLVPDSPVFNLPIAVHLSVGIDPQRLERALTAVTARHEILRTTFTSVDGRPLQVIHPEVAPAFVRHDFSSIPEARREARLLELATEEARRPFDLERGPLLRAVLVQTGESSNVLLLTLHHLVADGWSLGLLLRDVAGTYAGTLLPELPVQYADFAIWQREQLDSEASAAQLAFWREQLAGLAPLDLPTDFVRPTALTMAGARIYFELPGALVEGLATLARVEGVTLFMVALAAFQTLLHRYCRVSDVAVGTPIANRQQAELENLVGLFVNTLVLRTHITEGSSFRDLVREVQKTALDAYAHQDMPFERLVEALAPERSLARHPLFQVMFAFQNAPLPRGEELVVRSLDVDAGASAFDLALDLWPSGGGIKGRFEYSTELFRPETVRRMAEHFRHLLEEVVRDPDQPASRVPLAVNEERLRLRQRATQPTADPPRVDARIRAQAACTPHAVALEAPEGASTFFELEARATVLARGLQDAGAGPGALVAVHLERGPALVETLLAVLKAGAAFLPLSPDHPAARARELLREVAGAWARREGGQAIVVATASRWADRFRAERHRLLLLDELDATAEPLARHDEVPGTSGHAADDVACVLSTSGSRGEPKTVMIRHRSIANHARWMQRRFGVGPGDVAIQSTHPTFDVALWEIFGALSAGARLVIPPSQVTVDPARLAQTIAQSGVTVLQTVPSMLRWLVEEPSFREATRLRAVFCGAEAMPPDLLRAFRARMPGASLFNMYGPTEATIDASYWLCAAFDRAARVPIGSAIDNAQIHVLEPDGRHAPEGVVGEIYVGGEGVAAGYLTGGDPGAFVPDPFSVDPSARLFRTGDLARVLAEGVVELWGRADDQVKVRGFRVEPGEVQAALARHPRVREVFVTAAEDHLGMRILCAYLAPAEGPSSDELRAFLRESLPDYMVPSVFMALDRLPRTAGGKVDRRLLAPPQPAADREWTPPRSPVELVLAGIWKELLGLERIGADDDFFTIGGHSLLATRVLARVQQRLGVEVTLRAFFARPTLSGLAAMAERAAAQAPGAAGVALRSADALLAEMDRLSDDEVASILSHMIANDAAV